MKSIRNLITPGSGSASINTYTISISVGVFMIRQVGATERDNHYVKHRLVKFAVCSLLDASYTDGLFSPTSNVSETVADVER